MKAAFLDEKVLELKKDVIEANEVNDKKKKKKKKNKKKKNKENINPVVENIAQETVSIENFQDKDDITKSSDKGDSEPTNNTSLDDHNKNLTSQIHVSEEPNYADSTHQKHEEPTVENDYLKEIEENNSEDEGIDDYKEGGYHAVHIGEVLIDRYVVIQKLGWGHFSTVWLCKDFKYNSYVAIKIQKSAPHYLEAAYDEIEILQTVARNADKSEWLQSLKEYYKDEGKTRFTKDDCHCVQLLNCFIYQAYSGNHFCMVFEIMGVNLLEIIKRYSYKGIPIHLARKMAKQILIGLDYLHRMCGIIHTDLKPENILVCLTKEETKALVEGGQLSKTREYQERIKEYQKKYGIQFDEKPEPQMQLPNKNSKYYKKKLNKKKKKLRLKQEQEQEQIQSQAQGNTSTAAQGNTSTAAKEDPVSKKETIEIEDSYKQDKEETEEPWSQVKELEKNIKGPKLDENFKLKIVDLGNACWTHHHFSTKIQTRQYRSPEVITGLHYQPSADIWSLAGTIFEMITGDFLFEPRKGPNFKKNDDHLAQMVELLKIFPKKFAVASQRYKKFFNKDGQLKNIQSFHYWSLKDVLTDKYHLKEDEARSFANFLAPMLEYYPLKRASARELLLTNEWLFRPKNLNYKMTNEEYERFMTTKKLNQIEADTPIECPTYLDSDDHEADDEQDNYSDQDNDDELDYGPHDNYGYQRFLNRSYENGAFVGHNGGIDLNSLDQDPRWQFSRGRKQKI